MRMKIALDTARWPSLINFHSFPMCSNVYVSEQNYWLMSIRGLKYLHEHCYPAVIHRDLKSSNILLDANFNAKVKKERLCWNWCINYFPYIAIHLLCSHLFLCDPMTCWWIQLSDFGLAITDGSQNKNNIKLSGTLGYVAPEYLLDGMPAQLSTISCICIGHTSWSMNGYLIYS